MVQALSERVDAVGRREPGAVAAFALYVRQEILPHARAEEETLYRALGEHSELARFLRWEHEELLRRLQALPEEGDPATPLRAAAWAALFESHAVKEEALLLPALGRLGLDLAPLLAAMEEAFARHTGRVP